MTATCHQELPIRFQMKPEISAYHSKQTPQDATICEVLFSIIQQHLPEAENKN